MLRYSLLLGLTVSEFTPEEGLRKSLELFPGNFQELFLKNFFWKFPKISTNLVAIFSGYSPELVTRNLQVGSTIFVGRMHNFSRSNAQLQQVGCTTLVLGCTILIGWMHNLLQVGCTSLVCRMHNFSRSDAQLQQVECTTLVGRIHNFSRQDAQF